MTRSSRRWILQQYKGKYKLPHSNEETSQSSLPNSKNIYLKFHLNRPNFRVRVSFPVSLSAVCSSLGLHSTRSLQLPKRPGILQFSGNVARDVVAQRDGRRLIARSNPTPARYRRRPCGVAWMLFRTLMVGYINKWDFFAGAGKMVQLNAHHMRQILAASSESGLWKAFRDEWFYLICCSRQWLS
jgi:hypothetical protein